MFGILWPSHYLQFVRVSNATKSLQDMFLGRAQLLMFWRSLLMNTCYTLAWNIRCDKASNQGIMKISILGSVLCWELNVKSKDLKLRSKIFFTSICLGKFLTSTKSKLLPCSLLDWDFLRGEKWIALELNHITVLCLRAQKYRQRLLFLNRFGRKKIAHWIIFYLFITCTQKHHVHCKISC